MKEKQTQKKLPNYKPADTYFIINTGDRDLLPIRISLPKPPPLHLIDGYGLEPDEQYFKFKEIPKKLVKLQNDAFNICRDNYEKSRNNVITWDRVLEQYWKLFEEKRQDLTEEVQFIKNVYWWRENGYWFFNDGKPTYITGDYFDFINFWQMPDVKENGGRPEYRDKDRKKYLYWDYLKSTTETFSDVDKDGFAIRGEDGQFKMIDVGARTFYGALEPKVRRSGATQQGCHMVKKGVESVFGAYGTIISMDGDNAETHYYKKLIPAFNRYPYFLMSKSDATVGTPPKKIRYRGRATNYDTLALDSMIDYTDSAGERKNDGDKLFYYLNDEEGKALNIDVLERWNVNKLAQSTGAGSSIIGFCLHPSTVEQMDDGGLAYYKMAQLSNFYQRIPGKGQTHSGLGLCFFPGYEGMENFIDRFGMSVINKPTERQRRLRPDALFARLNMGAYEYIQKERDSLLRKGTPEALESYRSLRRKFPIQYAECWLGTSGDMGFDLEAVDKRLMELRRESKVIRGNFEWENGIADSKVVFVESKNGKFEVSKLFKGANNQKKKEHVYYGKRRKWEYHWAPMYPEKFTCGADPIRYENRTEAKLRDNNSRQSDGGIAVFWERDMTIDSDEDMREWESYRFIVSYNHRPHSTFEYNEDVLKVCVYYGSTVYLERNVENTWEHFLERGYGGYLQYDIDSTTGKFKDKPGMYSLKENKMALFTWIKDYIDARCHKEDFAAFLQEVKDIQGTEQMTRYDRFTAHGLAGMGSRSKAGNVLYTNNRTNHQDDFNIQNAVSFLSGR